ncbi:conserved hypothetical protein [Thermosinus carboxydivorans Nor1]|uniref:DZANK-type domain-containing protein n=1 Tax=Thermosinus carboxydivorans Nor1 TaxID=401526 RepID=A1HQE4_9FIRM|nr:zinc ribbon domain-containing protein [Thermosinus carboxydivorans]EAX47751.1 conserved hypothetical protein [Thermosinus carboxydivorans Nor1]
MITTISFIIGFIAAYWVYNDARSRGHELGTALLWSLGTLAMLIVFLPLYLLIGRKQAMKNTKRQEPVIDVEATPVNDQIHCPMCGAKVKEDYKVCPYCGYTLKPKCEACGRELSREWRTCPYCQTPAAPK